MGSKPVRASLVCALIASVETSINPDPGFTRVWHMALEKGIKTRSMRRQRFLADQHFDDHFTR